MTIVSALQTQSLSTLLGLSIFLPQTTAGVVLQQTAWVVSKWGFRTPKWQRFPVGFPFNLKPGFPTNRRGHARTEAAAKRDFRGLLAGGRHFPQGVLVAWIGFHSVLWVAPSRRIGGLVGRFPFTLYKRFYSLQSKPPFKGNLNEVGLSRANHESPVNGRVFFEDWLNPANWGAQVALLLLYTA